LILKDQNPNDLANSENDELYSVVEKEKDFDELNKIKNKEDIMRKMNKKQLNPRHSRFAGTYTALNMKALNDDNFQICHSHNSAKNNYFDDLVDNSAKKGKKQTKIYLLDAHKNSSTNQRAVISSVRKVLHHFSHDFLKRSYGVFMTNCSDMVKRNKLNDTEIAWYYSLAQFFMEFTRNLNNLDSNGKYELIKSTFSIEMFHTLQVYITKCIEMFRVDKKQVALWIKRMHKTVKLFKECLLLVKTFDQDDNLTFLIKNLKNQMFTIPEFREFFTNIFKDFNKSNLNISLLRALIEANQVFLEIFEKQSLTLVEPLKKIAKYTIFDTYANEIFDELKNEEEVLNNNDDGEEVTEENIYKLMNDKEFKMAVNLFKKLNKDSRVEGDSIIDKFDKLKEIYMKIDGEEDEDEMNKDYDNDNLLDFKKFLYRYSNPQILKLYVNIFGEYETNSDLQTRCCLKMFKYLSESIDFSQLLYQLNLFNQINKFNKDPLRRFGDNKELYNEAIDVFRVILNKFFKRIKENSDLYLKLLFLKDGEYLDHEDGSEGVKVKKRKNNNSIRLNTKYDEKLIDLYCKYSSTETNENEILDKIVDELEIEGEDGDVRRRRKRILDRMIELNLFKSDEMIKLSNEKKIRRIDLEWTENDYQELKECYERLKEEKCERIVDSLKKCLNKNRKKNDIILKLLEQNIISNKKELKGTRKTSNVKKRSDDDDDDDDKNPNIKSAEFVRSSADDSTSSSDEEQMNEEEEDSSNNKKRSIENRSPIETIDKPTKRQRLILSSEDDE
jgi:hypothetical protein